jgi:copper homeostasis protein CutC
MNPDGFEKAIGIFFQRPGLEYTRQLRSALDQDPEYLKTHQEVVTQGVQQVLTRGGIFWDEESLRERALKLVWEAVVRLRCVEVDRKVVRGKE